MNIDSERQENHAAFRRAYNSIATTYKQGWFVAISGGTIIADAPGFEELLTILARLGKDATEVLIVQAGVEYPEFATIFIVPGQPE